MPKKKKAVKKKAAVKAKVAKPKKVVKAKKTSKKATRTKKAVRKRVVRPARSSSSRGLNEAAPTPRSPGAGSAGQSGDIEALSGIESADSESVEELVEEGQDFEAELVDAVENAPDPDEAEITTEVPEDDIDPEPGSFSKRNRL